MQLQENFSLKKYNTFQVDANAQYFIECYSIEELEEALRLSKEKNIPYLLLGGGSNILLTKDFQGLVIALRLTGISEEPAGDNHILVTAKAGENWHQFVLYCISKNYGGLENLSLIPGNVGTSPIQNIGAYGTEIKDTFHSCKVLDTEDLRIKNLQLSECHFGYRDSIFKSTAKGRYIILEVSFLLTINQHNISATYGAIQQELDKKAIATPTIKDISDAVISIRQSKLPDPKVTGNAGSFFKNPVIPAAQFDKLKIQFENIPSYPSGLDVKVPAGWLIEQCGWKGKTIGNVGCHPLQALVIINATGNANGKEVFDFSSQIIDSVIEKFGITLEREVNIL
ncbi:UDP-N-acetylmuramate dehydrogenase [Elizabethkingia meningoseptica]|uniref:UDP-N-acetylmuramate dehydrogenase n=1 Tax=Elizabethkingia meningoseptica TaxID=238 RepID=UPI0022F19A05|nr:UDP-N-acetylmuramate dehydrogenase [Elizabethkingia meningoseptica]EJK5329835.1 UDP-N-acetylmuramate dehydrogenase [Elizabethkingia meningoseptica]MDE5468720.1 UDP-N-acetylmuramate dehydrogenase [Elizabethkingia meningoseptica]MDE5476032.1 UDP-N-acetylmuramate dehydrogenase [Elizabethkingia meningoseptica]MDE5478967.1 UDP-N-acetylmuramate dehydrogenase [Elizabethkingia meningoseptica]MDE5484916.1 UDP-N-acetylmuramate dehydrogenase [Elizabethkingia meningoseptica]